MSKIDLDKIHKAMEPSDLRHHSARLLDEKKYDAENLPSSHPMWELWQRMGEMFGNKWSSQQGESPNDTWVRGCAGLSEAQLAHGLSTTLRENYDWPPSLPSFRAMCAGNWEARIHRPFIPPRAIEDLGARERNMAAGNAALAEIYMLLKT